MLSGIKTKVRWRTHKGKAIAVALLVVIGVMIFSGFAGDIARALFYRLPSEGLGAAPYYPGPVSLEERILEADVIARVKLLSVSQGIEALTYTGAEDNDWVDATYVASMEFHFEVIEYLKGNGGVEFVGIVYGNEPYESRIGALAFGENLAETRDTFWDDREAIVFLSKGKGVMSTVAERDRYVLGQCGRSRLWAISRLLLDSQPSFKEMVARRGHRWQKRATLSHGCGASRRRILLRVHQLPGCEQCL